MHKIQFSWNHWRRSRRGSIALPFSALTACAGITTATMLLFMSGDVGQTEDGAHSSAVQQREAPRPASNGSSSDSVAESEVQHAGAFVPSDDTDAATQSRASQDAEFRDLLAGEWQQQYYGKRCLTVRTDGTATMVVEPEGIWSRLFGARLQVEIEWTLDNGRVNLQIIGGTPSEKIDLASRMWGECWTQPILELTENRLLLLGEDGVTKYDWTRVSESRG